MGKTANTAMTYERTPRTRLRFRSFTAKQTNDITKLSTPEVLRRLYHRHELLVWEAATILTWIWLIWEKLGS